jgi:hypothetical protein
MLAKIVEAMEAQFENLHRLMLTSFECEYVFGGVLASGFP